MQQENLNNENELIEYNELVNEENKKYKKLKIIQYVFWYISLVLIVIILHESYKTYKLNKNYKEEQKEEIALKDEAKKSNNKISDYIQELINQDNNEKKENKKYTYDNPYVPEGFDNIDGNWNDGYIIVDNIGNQFVWVPCTLTGLKNTIKLDKYDFCVNSTLNKDECEENIDNIKQFLDSVNKYQGFWIARYESGNDNGNVISKANCDVWNNITQEEAIKVSKKMYEDKNGIHSSLINSYAWDTTLKWLDLNNDNFSINSIKKGYHGKKIKKTGNYSVNNISDLAGNAWEWTTEKAYNEGVYRAGFQTMDYTTIGEPGFRGLIDSNKGYYLIGFRVIMYAD